MKLTAVTKLCFATGLALSSSFAGTPTIGVASAFGTFRVNDAKVEGNSNIFDGSQISAEQASVRVYLQSGAVLTLGSNSAGTLFKDHLLLQQGAAKIDGINSYAAQAGLVRLKGNEALSQAVIRLQGSTVQVATFAGSVNVLGNRGVFLRRINAGTAAEFDETNPGQSGATAEQSGATAEQSGATAGQSGATADQSGATAQTGAASAEERRRRRRREAALYLTLGVALGGLGLAVDAILQPGTPATSP